MAVDWLKIKNDYINGLGSYRKLAEQYGASLDSIKKRAAAENWKAERTKCAPKLHQKVQEKTEEKISEALSDEAATKVRIRGKLIGLAENWIDAQGNRIRDPGDFRKMVQSCLDLGVMDVQSSEDIDDDGLMEALGNVAADLFEDGDDSVILPEESE